MPHVDFPQTYCRGAIARRKITPPVGIYHRMWGAAATDRATGIHRPLTATALVLCAPDGPQATDGPVRQVLVSIDHCLFWNAELEALRSAVCRAADLQSDELHLACTHTHAAGLMDRSRAHLPGGELIGPYLEQLAVWISEAVIEALGSVEPLKIVYGTGRCPLARQRDFWDEANGLFACGFNPGAPADDTVLVARFTNEQGRTVGTLVNYACHPTTLAWDNSLISPDYVGAMREVVEQATSAPCLFLQGASGDLGPCEGYVGDVAVADRNGRELGYAALAALESLPRAGLRFEYAGPVVSGATLGTWDYRPLSPETLCEKHAWRCEPLRVDLAYRPDLPTRDQTESQLANWEQAERAAHAAGDAARARDCRAQAERMTRQLARLGSLPPGETMPVKIGVWKLGDAFWLNLPGEHYSQLQQALRERFPNCPLVISTVTDGWLPGYVPTAETYGKGIYQETIAVVAAGSLERLIEAIGQRISAWTPVAG